MGQRLWQIYLHMIKIHHCFVTRITAWISLSPLRFVASESRAEQEAFAQEGSRLLQDFCQLKPAFQGALQFHVGGVNFLGQCLQTQIIITVLVHTLS